MDFGDLPYSVIYDNEVPDSQEPILTAKFIDGTDYNLIAFPEPSGQKERILIYDRRVGYVTKTLEGRGSGRVVTITTLDRSHLGVHYDDRNFRVWNLKTGTNSLVVIDLYPNQQHHPMPTKETVLVCREEVATNQNEFRIINYLTGDILRSYPCPEHFPFWCFFFTKKVDSEDGSLEQVNQRRLLSYGKQQISIWKAPSNSLDYEKLKIIKLSRCNYYGIPLFIGDKTYSAIPTNQYGYIDIFDFENEETKSQIEVNKSNQGVYFIHRFPGNLICTMGEDCHLKLFQLVDSEKLQYRLCRSYKVPHDYLYNFDVSRDDGSYELVISSCDPSQVILAPSLFLPNRIREDEKKMRETDRSECLEFLMDELNRDDEEKKSQDSMIVIMNHEMENEIRVRLWTFLVLNSQLIQEKGGKDEFIISDCEFDGSFSISEDTIQRILLGEDNNEILRNDPERIIQLYIFFEKLQLYEQCAVLCLQIPNIIPTDKYFQLLCQCLKIFENLDILDLNNFKSMDSQAKENEGKNEEDEGEVDDDDNDEKKEKPEKEESSAFMYFENIKNPMTQQFIKLFVRNLKKNPIELERNWGKKFPQSDFFFDIFYGDVFESVRSFYDHMFATKCYCFNDCLSMNINRIYQEKDETKSSKLELISKNEVFSVNRQIMILKSRFIYSMIKFEGSENEEMEKTGKITILLLPPKELKCYIEYLYTSKIEEFENLLIINDEENIDVILNVCFCLMKHADLFFEFDLYYYLMKHVQKLFMKWIDETDDITACQKQKKEGERNLFLEKLERYEIPRLIQDSLPFKRQGEFIRFLGLYVFDENVLIQKLGFCENVINEFFVNCDSVQSEETEETKKEEFEDES